MSTESTYDLIVIGAGINGSGIARDASMRGLNVLLVDKGDVASGTTSWSTRLIHGGLRYLEHGEIGLVRESLRERERLLAIAPHLVKPLPLLIPMYAGDRRGPVLIRAGMVAYDVLSYDKSLPRHRILGRDETIRRLPGLGTEGLRGAAMYYDAQVEYAERLAVENVISAKDHGCEVRTYHRVDRLVVESGVVVGIEGTSLHSGATFVERAACVINVAGPWVDSVLSGGVATDRKLIGGTKGSHIVVGGFPGAPNDALYVEAQSDGRPFFIIPWNGQYLIGTTDERYDGDLDWVVASDEEIDYLLAETNRVLPRANLGRHDVRSSYAGVRPLPHRGEGSTGAITRRHLLIDHRDHQGVSGLFSIVGGKLTTYRELAELTVDAVVAFLERNVAACETASEPLPGAEPYEASGAELMNCGERTIDHLRDVYGSRADRVIKIAAETHLGDILDEHSGAIAAEVVYAMREEGATTLADVLLRRTMIGWGPDTGVGADVRAAEVAQRVFGWSNDQREAAVKAYRREIERYRPASLTSEAPVV